MNIKEGDRVNTFGFSYSCSEWAQYSDGEAVILHPPIDPHEPTSRSAMPLYGENAGKSEPGPFALWVVRYEDDGSVCERWVRDSDVIS